MNSILFTPSADALDKYIILLYDKELKFCPISFFCLDIKKLQKNKQKSDHS